MCQPTYHSTWEGNGRDKLHTHATYKSECSLSFLIRTNQSLLHVLFFSIQLQLPTSNDDVSVRKMDRSSG